MTERKQTYPLDQVFAQVFNPSKGKAKKADFDGDLVHVRTNRMITFKRAYERDGKVRCTKCGIEARHFVKERSKANGPWFLALYAVDQNNQEVLMTLDHILPQSKGGTSGQHNSQPLCVRCNQNKGNQVEKPKRQTKVDLEKEVARLKSVLGDKCAKLAQSERELGIAQTSLRKDREELEKTKAHFAILQKRVEQLARLLAEPVVIPGQRLGS